MSGVITSAVADNSEVLASYTMAVTTVATSHFSPVPSLSSCVYRFAPFPFPVSCPYSSCHWWLCAGFSKGFSLLLSSHVRLLFSLYVLHWLIHLLVLILPWRFFANAAVLGASTSSEMSDCVEEASAALSCPLCAKVTTLSTPLQNINVVHVSRGAYPSQCLLVL